MIEVYFTINAKEMLPSISFLIGSPEKIMSQQDVKVLLLGENEKGSSHLKLRLEQHGCHCWYAKSTEEALALLDGNEFQLVLITQPLRDGNAIVERLAELDCSLFYSYLVEDGCWWVPVVKHGKKCLGVPALRPSEFFIALDQIIRESEATVLT